jgi:hypothetical protein
LGNGGLTNAKKGNYVLGALESSGVSASLAFNGWPTKTRALLSTSPAIDAGTSAVVDAFFADLELQDQRKLGRIVDWDGVGGERFDIGAVELAFGATHA